MIIDSHRQTVISLIQEGEALLVRAGDMERAETLKSIRVAAEEKREPVIMFYGLYNAGKSTLGNALCHAGFETGDRPTTVSVEEVHWAGYTLIDTPGINAQTEHTEIAESAIRKSDVILFVVDNADTFDTEQVYMLRTPLINLRDIMRDAVKQYQDSSIYGEKQVLAENRESLLVSRQRLRDRLLTDGLRKIEAILGDVKAAAASGQTVEGVENRLNDALNALLQEAAKQEQTILQTEIKIKSAYEKSISDFLAQFYDPQLEKIDQSLAEVDSSCAEHTKNLNLMEDLVLKASNELVALP